MLPERQDVLAQPHLDPFGRRLDRRPFPGQHVPDLGLGGAVLALADVVEAVGQQPRGPPLSGPIAVSSRAGQLVIRDDAA